MTQRILLTGGNGFLGRAFLNSAAPGMEIIALGGRRHAQAQGLTVDLRDKESVRAAVREVRPTHVLNFASLGVTRDESTLSELLAVNAVGALHLVDALVEEGLAARTFLFGTAYEYADSTRRLDESAPLDPKSPYAISKTTLYYSLKQYGDALPLTFLRLFNIFGPGEPAERLIPFIARKARAGEEIPLTGGEQLRDFMFVPDLIALLHRLVATPAVEGSGLRTLNVGTGEGISLKSFIGYAAAALERLGLAPTLKFGALPYRAQDPMRCVADNDRLRALLGDLPFTDLQTAVEKTVLALHEQ
ncbi:NAD-dependent epimerase/dehydratase family protein [Roseateles sp. UC29_93]|uniref:NAD-dependent epimerase/dehydratase family protein n=1 Tax=Roseateles sp. UC29_93 TaxID=3350177 RepID=UPI0036726DFE